MNCTDTDDDFVWNPPAIPESNSDHVIGRNIWEDKTKCIPSLNKTRKEYANTLQKNLIDYNEFSVEYLKKSYSSDKFIAKHYTLLYNFCRYLNKNEPNKEIIKKFMLEFKAES